MEINELIKKAITISVLSYKNNYKLTLSHPETNKRFNYSNYRINKQSLTRIIDTSKKIVEFESIVKNSLKIPTKEIEEINKKAKIYLSNQLIFIAGSLKKAYPEIETFINSINNKKISYVIFKSDVFNFLKLPWELFPLKNNYLYSKFPIHRYYSTNENFNSNTKILIKDFNRIYNLFIYDKKYPGCSKTLNYIKKEKSVLVDTSLKKSTGYAKSEQYIYESFNEFYDEIPNFDFSKFDLLTLLISSHFKTGKKKYILGKSTILKSRFNSIIKKLRPDLLFLNSCNSRSLIENIYKFLQVSSICSTIDIYDETAALFSEQFFENILGGIEFTRAISEAKNKLIPVKNLIKNILVKTSTEKKYIYNTRHPLLFLLGFQYYSSKFLSFEISLFKSKFYSASKPYLFKGRKEGRTLSLKNYNARTIENKIEKYLEINSSNYCFIEGTWGCGKSYAVFSLFHKLLVKEDFYPLLCDAEQININKSLTSFMTQKLGLPLKQFTNVRKGRKLIIFLDDFDRMSFNRQKKLLAFIDKTIPGVNENFIKFVIITTTFNFDNIIFRLNPKYRTDKIFKITFYDDKEVKPVIKKMAEQYKSPKIVKKFNYWFQNKITKEVLIRPNYLRFFVKDILLSDNKFKTIDILGHYFNTFLPLNNNHYKIIFHLLKISKGKPVINNFINQSLDMTREKTGMSKSQFNKYINQLKEYNLIEDRNQEIILFNPLKYYFNKKMISILK